MPTPTQTRKTISGGRRDSKEVIRKRSRRVFERGTLCPVSRTPCAEWGQGRWQATSESK